ncbi:MAG: penicillin-binding transpeptidase domain-containing protein, partial [Acidimicrobiales bacterium]
GAQNVANMAKDLGITSPLAAVPSIALGTQNVSVLEMAAAYLTFYKDGIHVDPRAITKVTEGGSVLVDDRPTGRRRVLSPEVAQQVRTALGAVVSEGSGTLASLPNSDVWGKTGTTEEYGDAWFVGANEKLVTAVWMGYPEGQSKPLLNVEGVAKVAGGTWPAYIFRKFMYAAAPGDGKQTPLPALDVRALNAATPGATTTVPASAASANTAADTPASTTTTVAEAQSPGTTVANNSSPPVPATTPPATTPPGTSPVLTAPPKPVPVPTSSVSRTFPPITFP